MEYVISIAKRYNHARTHYKDPRNRGIKGAKPVLGVYVIDEFGTPDIALDDGSHKMDDVNASFQFIYPKMQKNGVYTVEDLHTAYWDEYGGGVDNADTFVNKAKQFIDSLNADHSRGAIPADFITRGTFSISFYDSVIVFEKGDVWRKEAPRTGRDSISGTIDTAVDSIRGAIINRIKGR